MKPLYTLVLKEEFIDDLAEAINWYEEKNERLGITFYNDVNTVLSRIESYPEGFAPLSQSYRQALLTHFPYVLVYKIYKKEVVVFALFHTSRNPRKKFRRK